MAGLELSRKILNGEVDASLKGSGHPFAINLPLEEIATGAYFITAFANVTVIDTTEGIYYSIDLKSISKTKTRIGIDRCWRNTSRISTGL